MLAASRARHEFSRMSPADHLAEERSAVDAASGAADKRGYVQAMFSDIAPRYDLLNHLLSFNIDRAWRRKAIAALEVERALSFGDPFASGEEERALGFAFEERHAVEADVVDVDAVGQIAAGELGAKFDFAVESISLEFHRRGNRLTRFDE